MSKFAKIVALENIDVEEASSLHNSGDEYVSPIDGEFVEDGSVIDSTLISVDELNEGAEVYSEAEADVSDLVETYNVLETDLKAGVPVTESAVIMLRQQLDRFERKYGVRVGGRPKFSRENFTKSEKQNTKFHGLAVESVGETLTKAKDAVIKFFVWLGKKIMELLKSIPNMFKSFINRHSVLVKRWEEVKDNEAKTPITSKNTIFRGVLLSNNDVTLDGILSLTKASFENNDANFENVVHMLKEIEEEISNTDPSDMVNIFKSVGDTTEFDSEFGSESKPLFGGVYYTTRFGTTFEFKEHHVSSDTTVQKEEFELDVLDDKGFKSLDKAYNDLIEKLAVYEGGFKQLDKISKAMIKVLKKAKDSTISEEIKAYKEANAAYLRFLTKTLGTFSNVLKASDAYLLAQIEARSGKEEKVGK